MQTSEQVIDEVPVVSIKGDIDLESSPKLRDFLKAKVAQKCPQLLLDFSKVNYIDSSGLATLIEYFQSIQTYNGKMALSALSPRVQNVFEIVRLQEIFSLYPDTKTALINLKK